MNNASRSMLASLWLVSLLPAGCSSSDNKTVAPPDEQPEDMMDPPAAGRFLLSLGTSKLPLPQGDGDSLTVAVERQNGFEGAVEITAQGLPEGVVAAPITIPEGETEAVLELEAGAKAPHSLPTSVTISGTSAKLHDERELTVTVCGVPGAVDTSFKGGNVMLPVGAGDAYAYAMAAQPDGKVVVVGTSHEHSGDFAVARFERDGDIDTSFGEAGLVMTQVGAGSDVARAVAIDEQGRIVVAGSADGAHGLDFAVVRYLENGQLDASFGEGGKTLVTFGEDSDTAYALALQGDGKIVVGGDSNRGSSQSGLDFALLRLTQDGQPDASFGEAGSTTLSVAQFGGRDSIYALALQEISGEERIVAAGGEGDFTLARFRADGQLDTTFGRQGKLNGLFGSTIGAARALTLTSDNEIVAAGHAQHDFALLKLSTQGALVSEFGAAGKLTTAVSADNWDEAQGVGVQADGKLLVAGWTYEGNSSSGNTALLRYTADGALDERFGDAGIVVAQVAAPSKADQGSALLIQPDDRVPSERLLVAGFASAGLSQFALTRFWR